MRLLSIFSKLKRMALPSRFLVSERGKRGTMQDIERDGTLPGDNPIRRAMDDRLQRTEIAEAFARHVLALDPSEGATVGVFGPWGSGKTSFINLARKSFDDAGIPILDFNPWLFSGTEQLVQRFFVEISAEMGENEELKKIGEALRRYGTALNSTASIASTLLALPQIELLVRKITKAAGNAATPESVVVQRTKIHRVLQEHDRRIIVILDDVDRLSGPEIRSVFKLVRLTASFPNVVYIVPCDRQRIEAALNEPEHGLSGSDYLEKIIQWSFNLPEIPAHLLTAQLWAAIEDALADIDAPGPSDEENWPDVRAEIIVPLIRNIRDVRRYAVAIRETVSALQGQIALTDVLALEAIRVFLPDVFRCIPGAMDGLTMESRTADIRFANSMERDTDDPLSAFYRPLKAQVDGLVLASEANDDLRAVGRAKEVTRALVRLLFPIGDRLMQLGERVSDPFFNVDAAQQLKERRVAEGNVLRLYLERVTSPDLLAFLDAERALARMTDRKRLDDFMRSFDSMRWLDVVSNFRYLEDRFRPEHVEPGIVVLLNLLPDVPERSLTEASPDGVVAYVGDAVQRLLNALGNHAAVAATVARILPEVTTLSSKVVLVVEIGYRKDVGSNLVSKTAADNFEVALCEEIRSASVDDLIGEHDLWSILLFASTSTVPSGDVFEVPDSTRLTFALLQSVCERMTPKFLGQGAVDMPPILRWERLIRIFKGYEELARWIRSLRVDFDSLSLWFETRKISIEEAEELLALAEEHLNRAPSEAG